MCEGGLTMTNTREKLIELMKTFKCNKAYRNPGYCAQRQLADHLIAN